MPRPVPPSIDTVAVLSRLSPLMPAAVYLFGSAASDRLRPESDIDLAMIPGGVCDPFAVFEIAQQLAGDLGCEVDLIDLTRASAVMRAMVVQTGRVLHVGDLRRQQEFEMYALSDYARANEERREVLEAYGKSLHAG